MGNPVIRMRSIDPAASPRTYERHDVVYVMLQVARDAGMVTAPAREDGPYGLMGQQPDLLFVRRPYEDRHYPGKLNAVIEHVEEEDRGKFRRTAVRGVREELGLGVKAKRLQRMGAIVVLDDENGYHINVEVYSLTLTDRHLRKIMPSDEVIDGSQVRMSWEQAISAPETMTTVDQAVIQHFAPVEMASIVPLLRE